MKNFYVLLLAILSTVMAWSQKVWDGPATGGSWAAALNWSDNVVPAATDVVQFGVGVSGEITNVPDISIAGLIITGGANVTLTKPDPGGNNTLTITNAAAANDFQIAAGSVLSLGNEINISTSAGAGGSIVGQLNVNATNTFTTNGATTVGSTGIISNVGTVSSAAITNLIFQSGATYIHAHNGGTIPVANWNVGSKTNITGITDAAPGGLVTQSFGDFEWNNSQTGDVNLSGNLRNVKGALKIAKTSGNATPRFLNLTSGTSHTLAIGGDLNIEQTGPATTNVRFVNEGDGDAIINVAGNYIHESGNLVFVEVNSPADDGTAILNLAGNFVQSGGDVDFTSGDPTGHSGQKGSMTIKGNFSQTAGTVRTTTFDPAIFNGLITFNNTGLQTFDVTDPEGVSYTNFIIANGSILKLASDLALTRDLVANSNWIGKLTVNSGAALDAFTFVVTTQITDDVEDPPAAFANFNLLAGGKLITANATGIQGSINTGANLTASFNSNADYEFQGASTGVFTTTTANTIRDLIVNNTSGNVTLAMPMNITRNLNLTSGLLTTTTNLATIGVSGTASVATPASFVNGPLAKTGTTAFTFPVGKAGAGFRNIGITAPSGSATFMAEFFREGSPAGTLEPALVRVSSCEYWDLSKTAGGAGVSANIVLSWEANSPCGGAYVTDPTTLRVAHLLGGVWIDEGWLSSTGNNTAGTVTSSDAPATFSPFALASSSASANPLPVLFADVKAYEKNNGVQIEWSNLTEKDVAGYIVERSANGIDFAAIAQQLPTSNQNDRANYNAFDASPDAGTNFYRIKAEEIAGKIVYSNVLSVNLGNAGESFRLYPNPVTNNQVSISLSNIKRGLYTLRVINTAGQDVFRQTITSQGRTITQTLNLPSVIKPGVYHMTITGDGYRENKKFIIR